MRFVNHYHDDPRYIAALAQTVREHWAVNGQAEQLVMSFHGVPERTLQLGDPYHCECMKTGRLLAEALGLSKDQYKLTFQSRFGKAKWLEPYTEPTLIAMAQQGVKKVDVICPGFTSDCLETLEEIQQEAQEAFLHAGGESFSYVPCLNNHAQWIEALTDISLDHMQAWDLSAPDAAALAASRASLMVDIVVSRTSPMESSRMLALELESHPRPKLEHEQVEDHGQQATRAEGQPEIEPAP
jgi:ferrochelatase